MVSGQVNSRKSALISHSGSKVGSEEPEPESHTVTALGHSSFHICDTFSSMNTDYLFTSGGSMTT